MNYKETSNILQLLLCLEYHLLLAHQASPKNDVVKCSIIIIIIIIYILFTLDTIALDSKTILWNLTLILHVCDLVIYLNRYPQKIYFLLNCIHSGIQMSTFKQFHMILIHTPLRIVKQSGIQTSHDTISCCLE